MINDDDQGNLKNSPEISRFAFALFDVLGFSRWVETESLNNITVIYQELIERAVLKPNKEGSLSAFHTPEGQFLEKGGRGQREAGVKSHFPTRE